MVNRQRYFEIVEIQIIFYAAEKELISIPIQIKNQLWGLEIEIKSKLKKLFLKYIETFNSVHYVFNYFW